MIYSIEKLIKIRINNYVEKKNGHFVFVFRCCLWIKYHHEMKFEYLLGGTRDDEKESIKRSQYTHVLLSINVFFFCWFNATKRWKVTLKKLTQNYMIAHLLQTLCNKCVCVCVCLIFILGPGRKVTKDFIYIFLSISIDLFTITMENMYEVLNRKVYPSY